MAVETLGPVQDFIKRPHSSGGNISPCPGNQLVQLARTNILFDLFVPLIVQIFLQPFGDFPGLFGREFLNGILDFGDGSRDCSLSEWACFAILNPLVEGQLQ